MTNLNDNLADAMLAILDATAATTESELDDCIDDARTAFLQLTADERDPLRDTFDRLCLLIISNH